MLASHKTTMALACLASIGCTDGGKLSIEGRVGQSSAALSSPDGASLALGDGTLVIQMARISVSEIELEGGSDDEREAELGAATIDLALDGGPTTVAVGQVEAGTYHTLGLELRRGGNSVRVEGTYADQPFVFTSGLDFEAEFKLEPEVDVPPNGEASVAVTFDLPAWFITEDAELLDPSDSANQTTIDARISASIAARAEIEHGDDD